MQKCISLIMDLYNREIVAYSILLNPNLVQIREILQDVTDKLPKEAAPIFIQAKTSLTNAENTKDI